MELFLVYALIGGIGIAVTAGPLGCFMIWRKMSFFGDSLSHAALLGVVIGIIFGINLNISSFFIAIIFVLLLYLQKSKHSYDNILAILAYGGISLSLVLLSFAENIRVDLMGLLFGDILALDYVDLIYIYSMSCIVIIWLILNWKKLLLITINEDVAASYGVNVNSVNLQYMLLISIFISLSIKIVGVLLITAMLIIPASGARNFSNTPTMMVILSCILGIISVFIGLLISYYVDSPSGASIVVCSVLFFIISQCFTMTKLL